MAIVEIHGGSVILMSSHHGDQLSLVLDPMAGKPVLDVIDLKQKEETYIIASAGGGAVPKEGVTSLVLHLTLSELTTLIINAGHIRDPAKFAEDVFNKRHEIIEL